MACLKKRLMPDINRLSLSFFSELYLISGNADGVKRLPTWTVEAASRRCWQPYLVLGLFPLLLAASTGWRRNTHLLRLINKPHLELLKIKSEFFFL